MPSARNRDLFATVTVARLLLSPVAALALALAACGPEISVAPDLPSHPLAEKAFAIPCDDALRDAAKALKTRGYRITGVDRDGGGGTVEGDKSGQVSRIRVQCGAGGVTVQPSGGGTWIEQGLRFSFNQIVEFGDKPWPPPTGPQVTLDLIQGPEMRLEFPQDLASAGVVPVRVRVLNGGERVVRVDPTRVRAHAGAGDVAPIAGTEVQKRLASIDGTIAAKLLRPARLRHGESDAGFVFFPAGSYRGATLMLIDDKTGEADEFEVSFGDAS